MEYFLQNLINALQWGSFYALIALGYSMVYSILMLFNFAHGDIFMVGSYIGFGVATALLGFVAMTGIPLPGWLILILTILFTMFFTSFVGIFIERVGYRPLREAPRASAAITGLMIGIILETGNLAIPPTAVFFGQTYNEFFNLLIDPWSTPFVLLFVSPFTFDQFIVPAEDCSWGEEL